MPKRKDLNGELPYDECDLESILKYAAKLTSKSLSEIFQKESGLIGGTKTKGYFGQLIETDYFYIDNNNYPVPDFDKVGMELKVTPMKEIKSGYVSKERLVLGIIDYNEVPIKHFRIFLDKNSHILIVFYLWKKDSDIYDYKVLKIVDWKPEPEELRIIREDWDVIEGYVLRGEAHLLSERHTKFLAACTKGTGHGSDMRTQPNSCELAKQRALSFKASFMTSLFHNHKDVNEMMIDVTGYEEKEESVFSDKWEEDNNFEEYVLSHFDKFIGKTCQEIESMLSIDLNSVPKQYYYLLVLNMIGIKKERIKEFDEAGILIKTMRLTVNGTPKEEMSFPAFKYDELVEQDWETSDFYEQLDHKFFIPVFQFGTRNTKCPRKELIFKGAFFWSIPDKDFITAGEVWLDTKNKILADDFDHFVKSSEQRIAHVRPHGKDSFDTYEYKDQKLVKKSFWLNRKYMKNVVKENLDRQSSLNKFD